MTKPTHRKRLSRYQPDKQAGQKVVIRERDREILRLVYEHRFLDTELLWRLLSVKSLGTTEYTVGRDGKKRPKKYGFGEKALYRRLQLLFHARYLDRHFLTDEPIGRGYGGPRAIYSLGPSSGRELPDMVGISPKEVRDIVEANKVKSPFLRHAIHIARFRVLIELACLASDGNVRLLFWEQGQRLRDSVVGRDHTGEERRFTVYPDAFFALAVKGRGIANYFLELDTGSMPIAANTERPDIRKKVLGFWHYQHARRFHRRYRYAVTPAGEVVGLCVLQKREMDSKSAPDSESSPRGFTVLIVAPGSVTEEGKPLGRIANMLSMIVELGKEFSTSSLFWFRGIDEIDFDRPYEVFSRSWLPVNPTKGLLSLIE